MAVQAPFVLSRATPSDMKTIIDLQYDCFPDFIRQIFMGCDSKDGLPIVEERYIAKMNEDPNDVWIQVKDRDSGTVVAASNWQIYMNGPSHGGHKDESPPELNGEILDKSKDMLARMNELRAKSMPGPFIHLHICFTHAAYRRRGAGGMMLKWGCDIADLLGIPGWIEASEEGNFLYKTFGFYDYEKIEGDIGGMAMKRDPHKVALEGGKFT